MFWIFIHSILCKEGSFTVSAGKIAEYDLKSGTSLMMVEWENVELLIAINISVYIFTPSDGYTFFTFKNDVIIGINASRSIKDVKFFCYYKPEKIATSPEYMLYITNMNSISINDNGLKKEQLQTCTLTLLGFIQ